MSIFTTIFPEDILKEKKASENIQATKEVIDNTELIEKIVHVMERSVISTVMLPSYLKLICSTCYVRSHT